MLPFHFQIHLGLDQQIVNGKTPPINKIIIKSNIWLNHTSAASNSTSNASFQSFHLSFKSRDCFLELCWGQLRYCPTHSKESSVDELALPVWLHSTGNGSNPWIGLDAKIYKSFSRLWCSLIFSNIGLNNFFLNTFWGCTGVGEVTNPQKVAYQQKLNIMVIQ